MLFIRTAVDKLLSLLYTGYTFLSLTHTVLIKMFKMFYARTTTTFYFQQSNDIRWSSLVIRPGTTPC